MIWILLIAPFALLLTGTPIFVAFLATSAIVLLWFMDVPLTVVHQVMFGSVDKYTLIALPFFIFSGLVMGRGGMSQRLVDWSQSLLGGIRGSLGLTTVSAVTIFGAINGSGPATVAAVGRIVYPPLLRHGYGEKFSSGLVIATGGIATLIPPSITMILYGAAAQQSVAHLFIAGVVPGLLVAALTAAYVYYYAIRRGIATGGAFQWARFARASKDGLLALGSPAIILGGFYLGVFSPTEAGGIAAIYAILVTTVIYREMSWKALWNVGVTTAYLTAQVFIIVAAAGVYAWLLTVTNVPQAVVEFMRGVSNERWIALLIINIFLLVVGCLIDPASAILVLTPILIPVVQAYDINLIHFGVIMAVNLEIGMFTPPVGLNLFVAQALFRTRLSTMYAGLVPFLIVNLIALALIASFPELSLYLTQFIR